MNAPHHLATAAAAAAEATGTSELERLLQQQARTFTPIDLLQDSNFDKLWRMAEALANSALSVPKELKGNIGDCLAIVTQAMIWGLNPFAVAQKAHVINGKLGYEAQLVNAVVMQSGAIKGSFTYEFNGDSCRVGAVLRGETEITWGEWLSAATVTTKNSPLWKTNPKQQMGYLQVKNWARAYCPGAVLGVYSADELELMPEAMTPAETVSALSNLPGLPEWPAESFRAQFARWEKAVQAGIKTPDDIVALASTKGLLTAAQKAEILAIKKTEPAKTDEDPFVADMNAAEAQGAAQ
jgi:hypothetical protein